MGEVTRLGDGRWKRGIASPNPSGRPRGSRNRQSLLVERLLAERAPELIELCIEEALSGNNTALKLCVERLLSALKSRPIQIELPQIQTPEDVLAAVEVIRQELAAGNLNAEEFELLMRTIDHARAAIESLNLERRIEDQEQRIRELQR